jgi:AraC-like DNA-binding protein
MDCAAAAIRGKALTESLESPSGPSSRWFSSDDVPECERLAVLNEAFGSSAFPCEIAPTGDDRLYMAGHAIALPGVFITHGVNRGVEYRRTARHVAADDVFMLTVTLDGRYRVRQRREEFLVRPGEGWAAVSDEAATAANVAGRTRESLSLMLPRSVFEHARLDVGGLLRQPIRCDNAAMRMLVAYVHGIESAGASLPPMLEQRAAEHVSDLALLALQAGGDAAQLASERSLPAARLHKLKQDVHRCVEQGQALQLPELAGRHGISPVYVQKLFERDGTSFSAYVLEHRLAHVHRRLRNPRFAGRSISRIVYDAGFNNLSWFNRAFRRRYGATPSEVRAGR